MRRSRTVLLSAMAAVVLATTSIAEGAAAEPFVAKVKDPVCTHTGSTNGFGTQNLTARMTENGQNGTNYMRIFGTFQVREGGTWSKVYTYGPYASTTFPNDASSHTHLQTFQWPFRDVDVGGTFRWKMRFEWWDQRPGPDHKLATKFRYGPSCTA